MIAVVKDPATQSLEHVRVVMDIKEMTAQVTFSIMFSYTVSKKIGISRPDRGGHRIFGSQVVFCYDVSVIE